MDENTFTSYAYWTSLIRAGFRPFVSGHSNKPESLAAIGVVWDLKGLVPNVGIVPNKKVGQWFLSDFFLALLLSGGSLLIRPCIKRGRP